ncbi:MAG TPA: hypothetical protein VGD94_01615 [Vicinamibacterales bacterium]
MKATDRHTTDTPKPDTRVLDYVSRAPMTYPVPFDLLPKWPPVPASATKNAEGKAGRN